MQAKGFFGRLQGRFSLSTAGTPRFARSLLAGLALVMLASCSKNTYLEIKLTGGYTNVRSIVLTVSYPKADAAFGHTASFFKDGNEAGTAPVQFPATLVIELREFADLSTVNLSATALDAAQLPVATATGSVVVHQNAVTPVTLDFGGTTDGGVTDSGVTDSGADAARDAGAGADACTVVEVKAGESASFVETAGPTPTAPSGDTLWAGSSGGSLFSTWLRFPKRGTLVAPTGTKLASITLAMRVLEARGTSFAVGVSYSPTDNWSASAPPTVADYALLMPASDTFAVTPVAGTEAAYQLSPSVKTWTDLIASGPISLVVRNNVGGTPATSGSLVAYQGGSSGSTTTPAPVLRFRFCPQ